MFPADCLEQKCTSTYFIVSVGSVVKRRVSDSQISCPSMSWYPDTVLMWFWHSQWLMTGLRSPFHTETDLDLEHRAVCTITHLHIRNIYIYIYMYMYIYIHDNSYSFAVSFFWYLFFFELKCTERSRISCREYIVPSYFEIWLKHSLRLRISILSDLIVFVDITWSSEQWSK